MTGGQHGEPPRPKRVFVSYAWGEGDDYRLWVKRLGTRLREDGVDARLDAWHAAKTDNIAEFMNREIRQADWVLVLCSPLYQTNVRATEDGGRVAGTGWETRLLTTSAMVDNRNKVLAVLARGDWQHAAPDSVRGQLYFDLSSPSTFERNYKELLQAIIGTEERAPALGGLPNNLGVEPVDALGGTDDVPRAQVDRSAHYFSHQRQMIEERARSVIGRAYVETALDQFVATQRRGYFILEGSPGQGKTSIAAKLVANRGCVHHFFGRTGRHSSHNILSALIAQLDTSIDVQTLATASVDALNVVFDQALRRAANDAPPVVLVIDGLNELPAEDGPELLFLPTDSLPDRVYVMVTSQPSERLTRLREELATVPTLVYKLGPLHADEMREIILLSHPGATYSLIRRLGEASHGNPLLLRASLDTLADESDADTDALPDAVEGYYRRAMRRLGDERIVRDVLGLLAVSRRSLSLTELSQITGATQRSIHAEAIGRLRPFLLEVDRSFAFYHERFHDFVVRELLYEDERRGCHGKIARWLLGRDGSGRGYYWTSLAYHLFHSGESERVVELIDEQFLAAKLQRFGYSVLEDLELLASALLNTRDPSFVERCVSRLDGLRQIVGSDLVDELARSVQRNRPLTASSRSSAIVPRISEVAGIDAYAVLLPKRDVTADFVEGVSRNGHLVVAIGDAPLSGLKSAFVARFIGSLFRSLVLSADAPDVDQILNRVSAAISRHPYFERVSMQCVEVAPYRGLMTLASAGHPFPVLYSTRYGGCDQLPVRGALLHAQDPRMSEVWRYRVRHAEIEAGDVLVMVSDGIVDGGPVDDPYGYRFINVIERHARDSARRVGEAIVNGWREHLNDRLASDDATIVVLKMTGKAGEAHGDDT